MGEEELEVEVHSHSGWVRSELLPPRLVTQLGLLLLATGPPGARHGDCGQHPSLGSLRAGPAFIDLPAREPPWKEETVPPSPRDKGGRRPRLGGLDVQEGAASLGQQQALPQVALGVPAAGLGRSPRMGSWLGLLRAEALGLKQSGPVF